MLKPVLRLNPHIASIAVVNEAIGRNIAVFALPRSTKTLDNSLGDILHVPDAVLLTLPIDPEHEISMP